MTAATKKEELKVILNKHNASRQEKFRAEFKKKKQKRVEVIVHVDDEPAIRELAVVLNRKRRT